MTQQDSKAFTPTISGLKNDGVEVKVFKVEKYTEADPDSGELLTLWRRRDEKRDLRVRFTNAVMSDIEDQYGSMESWQQLISASPYKVVLATFVTVTGKPREQVSEMLDSANNEEYQIALLLAWMMAMGADSSKLGKLLSSANKLGQAKDRLINGAMETVERADAALDQNFPGTNFSEDGSQPAAASSPSGDTAPDKHSLSSEQLVPSPRTNGAKRKHQPVA